MDRILKQVQVRSMTSPSMKSDYKCEVCKDTTFVPGPNGMKRCDCFKKELTERRWKRFGVDPNEVKLIKDYETTTPEKLKARNAAVNYVKNFEEIKGQRNNSLALLGQPGAGKTHLALGIGKALMERDKYTEVVYMPYLEVMQELKANVFDEEVYIKIQSKYTNAELLIIDDLFKDKVKKGQLTGELKESDMKHIYPIINQRYISHKPTIYNSECNANMLLDLDEALGGRIIECCKDNIVIFKYCKENNYRLQGV